VTLSVEEIAHLRAHIAEARGCAEDDRIGLRQLGGFCDWNRHAFLKRARR
jgi:hypothetical protein